MKRRIQLAVIISAILLFFSACMDRREAGSAINENQKASVPSSIEKLP